MYEACIISLLLLIDGLIKAVLARNDFKTPVFSNFFLKRLRALSMDSFSLMLIISIFSMSWAAKIVQSNSFLQILF